MDSLAGYALLALAPLLALLVLLVGLRWPAQAAMPVGYALVAALALGVWEMDLTHVAAASVQGLIAAAGLVYVVFAAALLHAVLGAGGAMRTIRAAVTRISPDRRVQAILVGWLFGGLAEGATGYAMGAVLAAPLLLGLGFPPLAAALVALIGQSTSISFGALGAPISVGLREGLGASVAVEDYLFGLGAGLPRYLDFVAVRVALLHALTGILVPLFVAGALTRLFGRNRSFAEGLSVWRFALFAALAVLVPYMGAAVLLGPAYPALLGGLVGLVVVTLAASRGFLLPAPPAEFPERADRADGWTGRLAPGEEVETTEARMGLLAACVPYLLLLAVLVLARLPGSPVGALLSRVSISPGGIFGTAIAGVSQPLYLVGTGLCIAVLAAAAAHRLTLPQIAASSRAAAGQAGRAGLALLYALPLLHVYMASGPSFNRSGLQGMAAMLAQAAAAVAGPAWPLLAPWLGALGTFVGGSSVASDRMFALFQFATAQNLGASPSVVIAAQEVGAAAGSMTGLHAVIAVAAVAGVLGREGTLLRWSFFPMACTCLLAGSLGLVWVQGFGLNTGTLALLALLCALGYASAVLRRDRPRTGDSSFPGPPETLSS